MRATIPVIFAKSADTPTTTVRCEFRVDESSPLYVQRLFRTPSTGKPRLSRIPFPNTTRMPRGDPLFLAETFPTSSVCFYSRYSPRPFHANCRVFLFFFFFFIATDSFRPLYEKSVSFSFLHRVSVLVASDANVWGPASHPAN